MAVSPYTEAGDTSKPVKRIRWATQRVTGRKASQKRKSIFARHGSKRVADEKKRESDGTDPDLQKSETDGVDEEEEKPGKRSIFVNIPLPDSARDEDGKPKQNFSRNKIRTAKYTPISFIPKNLWLQFHNVANIYFLFVVILSFFSVFGVDNPGLAAVPLIVIVVVTAIKDAIEDWRRTVLDTQINNAPVHRL
ncbi:hypothetical protein KC350_g16292, partial [Hortaea werneckii]